MLRSASGFLPKVTLSETWSRTDNPLMVLGTKLNQEIVTPADFNPAVMNNPDAISNYNTRLAVMQPVFNGGKEYLGRKQAKLAREASVQDRDRTRQETVFNVVKAYYGLLLAKEYDKVALQSLETSEANVKLAEARYKAGAVLQSDLLRAKVQLAEVKEMVTRSENGVKLAAANLNFAMGVPQGRRVRRRRRALRTGHEGRTGRHDQRGRCRNGRTSVHGAEPENAEKSVTRRAPTTCRA